jgi:hypothetical protein
MEERCFILVFLLSSSASTKIIGYKREEPTLIGIKPQDG